VVNLTVIQSGLSAHPAIGKAGDEPGKGGIGHRKIPGCGFMLPIAVVN
jgi:hypothetical protein